MYTWEDVIMSVEQLLTVQEISNLLKVPRHYVYYLTHTKRIPFLKIGGNLRFKQSDIDEWIRSMEVKDVGIQERE